MQAPTERFSDRVEDYVRYRPSYPAQVIELIAKTAAIDEDSRLADIGCGTGIFTHLLTKLECKVVGIEPNDPMRNAAIGALSDIPNLEIRKATAEETGLSDTSVNAITAAQAFHWFDKEKCREEFRRILKPNGWIFLVWNGRKTEDSQFLSEYEKVLKRFAPDYSKACHRSTPDEEILAWFESQSAKVAGFDNLQRVDMQGLLGRAYSSSYVPASGTLEREELTKELVSIFNAYQLEGFVEMEYETKIFFGQI